MGIFRYPAGDFQRFRPENVVIRSLETEGQFAKARNWRAFLRFLWVNYTGAVLLFLAGVGGFEPPYGGIKIRCVAA